MFFSQPQTSLTQNLLAAGTTNRGPTAPSCWTSPNGQRYTTHPGSRLLFPTLCRPTAAVARVDVPAVEPNRTQKMPRRKATRAQDRAQRIEAERRLNDDYVTQRNRPPPF